MYKKSENSHVNYPTDFIYLPRWNDNNIKSFEGINGIVYLILRDPDGPAAIRHHVAAFKKFLLNFPKLESVPFVLDAYSGGRGSDGRVACDEGELVFERPWIDFKGFDDIADDDLNRKFQANALVKTVASISEPEKCPTVKVRLAWRR